MTIRKPLPRRTLLRGAAGAAIALPFLDAMQPARAQNAGVATRFIVFFSANGTIIEQWRPQGGERDFTFGEGRILSPLESWKDKLIVLEGLSMESRSRGPGGNGHDLGMGHMLTCQELVVGPSGIGEFSHLPDGTVGGISIDQEVAQQIGGGTRFSSLEFGVQCHLDTARQLTSRMSYRGPFEAVPPENDPRAAFSTIFAGIGADQDELRALFDQKRSVLDEVKRELSLLTPRVSAGDRHKLEAHLESIREVEKSLTEFETAESCTAPDEPGEMDHLRNDNFPAVGAAQMKLAATALACDLTSVASIQWATAQANTRFTWLGHSESHHMISHEADDTAEARGQQAAIDNWYAAQFATLLEHLDSVPEGDGTVLDNTVVLWANEQGNGDLHTKEGIPFVLAGGSKAWETGRSLNYEGHAHNDLYVSILNALGVETDTFGIADLCQGPLPGLNG